MRATTNTRRQAYRFQIAAPTCGLWTAGHSLSSVSREAVRASVGRAPDHRADGAAPPLTSLA